MTERQRVCAEIKRLIERVIPRNSDEPFAQGAQVACSAIYWLVDDVARRRSVKRK